MPEDALRKPGSPGELFRVFNALALQGFGGVLPVARPSTAFGKASFTPIA